VGAAMKKRVEVGGAAKKRVDGAETNSIVNFQFSKFHF